MWDSAPALLICEVMGGVWGTGCVLWGCQTHMVPVPVGQELQEPCPEPWRASRGGGRNGLGDTGTQGHRLGAAGPLCPLLWEQGLEGGQLLGARGSPGQAESFWGWLEKCSPTDVSASSDQDSMRTPGNAGAGAFPLQGL